MCSTKKKQSQEDQNCPGLVLKRSVKGGFNDKMTLDQKPQEVKIGAPWSQAALPGGIPTNTQRLALDYGELPA